MRTEDQQGATSLEDRPAFGVLAGMPRHDGRGRAHWRPFTTLPGWRYWHVAASASTPRPCKAREFVLADAGVV
jgi:hypothetical protein